MTDRQYTVTWSYDCCVGSPEEAAELASEVMLTHGGLGGDGLHGGHTEVVVECIDGTSCDVDLAKLAKGGNTPLVPRTAASAVMIALVKLRCRQYLHFAVEEVRFHRERPRLDSLRRAAFFIGVAEGQALVLYDTQSVAWRFLRAVQKVRATVDGLAVEVSP